MRSMPHLWSGHAGGMSLEGCVGLLDFCPIIFQTSQVLTICSTSFNAEGQMNPCLKAFPTRGLTPM
jgi:hypothetical protein